MKVLKKFLLSVLFACSFLVIFNSIDVSAKTPKFSSREYTIKVGESKKLKLKNANKNKVKWIVENTKCITISSKGTVKGIKEGTAIVMAKYKNKYYAVIINVEPAYPSHTFYDEVICPISESWIKYEETKYDTYQIVNYTLEDASMLNYIQVLPLESEDYVKLFTSESGCKQYNEVFAKSSKINGAKTLVKKEPNSEYYYSIMTGETVNGNTIVISRCIGDKYIVLYGLTNLNHKAISNEIKESAVGLAMGIEYTPTEVPITPVG